MRKFRMLVMLAVIVAGGFSVTGCDSSPVAPDNCLDPSGILIPC